MLRGRAAGHRITALSDRYSQPPAYHALTAGFLARAIDLAGGAAPARTARKALRIAVRTLWAYQSPDGDVAYMGRSQGQSWALAFAMLAAERAAGRGCDDQTQDFLAVGDRALRRLGRAAPGRPERDGDRPLGERPGDDPRARRLRGRRRLQRAHADRARVGAEGRPPAPRLPARRDHGRAHRAPTRCCPFETGTFAVLRRGRVWMAVKRVSQGDDPRAGFGLRALKYLGDDGRWVDLMPAAPRIAGAPTTFGPALIPRSGRLALPEGRAPEDAAAGGSRSTAAGSRPRGSGSGAGSSSGSRPRAASGWSSRPAGATRSSPRRCFAGRPAAAGRIATGAARRGPRGRQADRGRPGPVRLHEHRSTPGGPTSRSGRAGSG